ncbi:unnamed protein product [Trichobilharzia regenti]|nr:unnamed protein product [Trichobilharzia regenti]
MSGSSDELSHEDEDFSLLGMSESNTTGLSECGTAMNGSNSLPVNTTGLHHHHNHGQHPHHHPHHHHHGNNNNSMYGNYNQNLMLGIGGGSGSLTGSSSSGTSITGGGVGGLGDEVVHSVVISSRGMTRMHTGNTSGGNGLGGNSGSRPSSGKSAGSKRSKDQKTTRVSLKFQILKQLLSYLYC